MHESAFILMKKFARNRVLPRASVADVGSYDVNGTFKSLFKKCNYIGMDVQAGPNVNKIIDPYDFGDEQYDVVISGNTMEHVEDLSAWTAQIKKICKPNGLICIITPHTIPEHKYPIDCWRILPDGMRWLFRDCQILECRKEEIDTILIAKKPI